MKFEGLDGNEHIYFYLKDDEHGWLSNFYPSPIKTNMRTYPTVEHLYQSAKTYDEEIADWIAKAPKPYLAMRVGRCLRDKDGFEKESWENVKNGMMYSALILKFKQNIELRVKLMETGRAILHEDSPTDKYWGRKGKDMLGKILMEVRQIVWMWDGTDV
jgi:ribA/ribD-fused uncharacterized protein